MKYTVITFTDPEMFAGTVKEMLKKGWLPQGGVTVDVDKRFYQAMVKLEEGEEYPA